MDSTASQQAPEQQGVEFLKQQDYIFFRQAWINRWIGWICGWGGTALAAFGGIWVKGHPNDGTFLMWTGLIAAALTGVTQTVKPEVWADAYYRGHLLLEQVIGDHVMGKATPDDLQKAWHLAQGGLPGAKKAD
jgi:hypothetical protein